jgi:Right handed beta helix region
MKWIVFILLLFWINMLNSQTTIPAGNVSGTWDLAGSPYLIEGEIKIPCGETLTINPGCLIEFQGHYKFNVQGRILAIGTEQDSIRFTVADTTGFHLPEVPDGGWHGIRFLNTSTTNDSSKIMYSILEFGKAVGETFEDRSGGGLYVENYSKLKFSNNLIQKNYSHYYSGGIFIESSNIVIEYCRISSNYRCGLVDADQNIAVNHCIISDNTIYGISGVQAVNNCLVYGNIGCGIYLCSSITNCEIYDNEVGVGSFLFESQVRNSLISGNEYGISFSNDGELLDFTIINSTITDNQTGLSVHTTGTNMMPGSSEVFLTNSIFNNDVDFDFSGFNCTCFLRMEYSIQYC